MIDLPRSPHNWQSIAEESIRVNRELLVCIKTYQRIVDQELEKNSRYRQGLSAIAFHDCGAQAAKKIARETLEVKRG